MYSLKLNDRQFINERIINVVEHFVGNVFLNIFSVFLTFTSNFQSFISYFLNFSKYWHFLLVVHHKVIRTMFYGTSEVLINKLF